MENKRKTVYQQKRKNNKKLMFIFLANKASTHARYVYDEYLLITFISLQTRFPLLAPGLVDDFCRRQESHWEEEKNVMLNEFYAVSLVKPLGFRCVVGSVDSSLVSCRLSYKNHFLTSTGLNMKSFSWLIVGKATSHSGFFSFYHYYKQNRWISKFELEFKDVDTSQ